MNDWAKDAEKELRYRIAEFFVSLEYAAEGSPEVDTVLRQYKKTFGIDEESARELRTVAYKDR